MITPDKKNVACMAISAVGLAFLTWFVATISCGCGSAPPINPSGNTIPAFAVVEPGVARGGEPKTAADWSWLASHGYTNVVTLHTSDEGSDTAAAGMMVHRHPIDTLQQLTTGPNEADFNQAISEIKPGTFVHCLHGQDRTGLAIGIYRLREGTNKSAAWQEMTNHGFHPALHGLTKYWENQ
jgi:tyrosine-protein phosphatase SIW14